MLTLYLILSPILFAVLIATFKNKYAKNIAILSSIISVLITGYIQSQFSLGEFAELESNTKWLSSIHSNFHFKITSWNLLMIHLTSLAFLLVYAWSYGKEIKKANTFYALMNLTQAGLYGVFIAFDGLVFYLFWELALIPVYFLSSIWGGPRRVEVTFKFFIYTFLGSVLMLVALIYLYFRHQETFDWNQWVSASQNTIVPIDQKWLFGLMLIAFGIKIPIFPFHTWQPDTYEQAPRPVVMILSAVMAKMGLFAIIQWQIFVLPDAFDLMGKLVISLASISIIYASLMAMVENNMIKIVAYSSISHLSMMALALFTNREISIEGVMFQMFSHGIVVIGLWMIIDLIQEKLNINTIKDIKGGLATTSPVLAIFLVLFGFANIALPLTSSFIGEVIILKNIFDFSPYLMLGVGTSIILSAVYTLRLIRNILYGSSENQKIEINFLQWTVLFSIATLILVIGVYPKPILDLLSQISIQIRSFIN